MDISLEMIFFLSLIRLFLLQPSSRKVMGESTWKRTLLG